MLAAREAITKGYPVLLTRHVILVLVAVILQVIIFLALLIPFRLARGTVWEATAYFARFASLLEARPGVFGCRICRERSPRLPDRSLCQPDRYCRFFTSTGVSVGWLVSSVGRFLTRVRQIEAPHPNGF